MTEFLENNVQDLFTEIIDRGLAEGVADREAFSQLVSDVIIAKRSVGELHDDNDLEALEDELKARWPEFAARLEKQVL